jgi:heme ABC exporter ATP-binding subunit CcmA
VDSRRRVERVEVERLSRLFGSTWALRDVQASFSPGKLNLVVGSNGSGKTTLLGVIGTLTKPSAGRVRYVPDQTADEVRREIGWGSHEALMYVDLSPRENIELTAQLHGIDPKTAWQAASDRFGLATFASRPVRVLSRGQRQRAALARALVHGPSLLLLDEPTTGLDKDGVARLLDVLKQELEAGVIVIVVTHEPELFGTMPTEELRLDRGRVARAS